MGPTIANHVRFDPRQVVMPIDAGKTEALLQALGLHDKWSHIVEGLPIGFDVGVHDLPSRTIISDNHTSSRLDPDFISSYIEGEEAAGRYSRAFEPDELETLIGPFRTSPIGLVPKPNSAKRYRMIQDLSFPWDNPELVSVNAGIKAEDFPTVWGTFNITSELIRSLPVGCHAATFDISAAYRLTPVWPSQQNALCVAWRGKVWVDRAVMFGLASSAGVFGCVADMLVDIYVASGFGPLVKWVDDFFRHSASRTVMDQVGVHRRDSGNWGSLEPREAMTTSPGSALYWFRLAPSLKICEHTSRETRSGSGSGAGMVWGRFQGICSRGSKPTWKASPHLWDIFLTPTFSPLNCTVCSLISFSTSMPFAPNWCPGRLTLDSGPVGHRAEPVPIAEFSARGHWMVGGCQYLFRCWGHRWWFLGSLEVGQRCSGGAKAAFQHWLGRGSGGRAGLTYGAISSNPSSRTLSGPF